MRHATLYTISTLCITLTLFFLFILASTTVTALWSCKSAGACTTNSECAPGFDCCRKFLKCQDTNGVYWDFINVCAPTGCSADTTTTYAYANDFTPATVASAKVQTVPDVYVDVDNQDDGYSDDTKNIVPPASYSLNGCQGFVTVSCLMSDAQEPTATLDGTDCGAAYLGPIPSGSNSWYVFKCGSADGASPSAQTHIAKCELGSSWHTRTFNLLSDPDQCQNSCTGTWLSEAWSAWTGDASPAAGQYCCGDDTMEVYREKYYSYDWSTVTKQVNRDLCCQQSTDCTSLAEGSGARECYVQGSLMGVSSTNNGWICENNVWYECNANKLCKTKQGKMCALEGIDYLWTSAPPAESGTSECRDQFDNDCNGEEDYDTDSTPDHGDAGCPVGVSAASASPASVEQNGVVDVQCTSTVGETNAIFVYRDVDDSNSYTAGDVDCGWKAGSGWVGNTATFKDCNVGSTTGAVTFRCSVYDGGVKPYDRAYMTGTEKEATVTVTASTCAVYSDQVSCEADASCDWVDQCNDPFERASYGCLDAPASPSESCSLACGAQCDGSTSIPNGDCNATTCTPECDAGYSWNGTDCVAYVCTGLDPANASLCAGDDQGLTADTPKSLVSSCTAAQKCEVHL